MFEKRFLLAVIDLNNDSVLIGPEELTFQATEELCRCEPLLLERAMKNYRIRVNHRVSFEPVIRDLLTNKRWAIQGRDVTGRKPYGF